MRFLDALKQKKAIGQIPLIPDIKCFSPKEGDLIRGRDPVQLALALEQAGACAISVVTEEQEFHGSMEMLRQICRAVRVPVLRKDFVETEQDLEETLDAGAQAVLLMVSCLGEDRLTQLYHAALARGLMPLVETHTGEELAFAFRLHAPLVGINNRDITVLEKDDGTVMHAGSVLKEAGKHDCFIVVESALRNGEDVRNALRNNADAALVGTAILRASDPQRQYQTMTRRCGLKICGLMHEEDVDACLRQSVDMCGFVVEYPVDVRWNLDADTAAPLLRRAGRQALTCVVTGGAPDQVIALARRLKPDYLQLHYTESLQETGAIAQALRQEGIGVIRSVPSDAQRRRQMFGTDDLAEIVRLLDQTPVAAVLLDSRDAGNAARGGDGILEALGADSHLSDLRQCLKDPDKLLIAGGGITPDNAGDVIRSLHPDMLDVMTGAEDASGRKSTDRIRRLVQAVS